MTDRVAMELYFMGFSGERNNIHQDLKDYLDYMKRFRNYQDAGTKSFDEKPMTFKQFLVAAEEWDRDYFKSWQQDRKESVGITGVYRGTPKRVVQLEELFCL